MKKARQLFQVFVKPAGSRCNLACEYCYYLDKTDLFSPSKPMRMERDMLELYIKQHIQGANDPLITFSWHGGEPTLLGIDYFETVVELQKKHQL